MADTALGYLHPNDISASFHDSVLELLGYDLTRSRRLGPWIKMRSSGTGLPEARNRVAQSLLDEPDIDWLFMVDADMGFAPDIVDRLHACADPAERPIVGGLCFAQRETHQDGLGGFRCAARPTILDWQQHPAGHMCFMGRADYPVNTLIRADATGAACLLIHRSVFERILEKYGPTWFDRTRGTDGTLLGEDTSFFVRCAALDIPLHIHTGIRTNHHKELWLGEADFWSQFTPPPATELVDVIVPVLHRPQNVRPLLESLTASTGLATAWFVCEPDDLIEQAEVLKHGGSVLIHPGTFAEKVNHAVDSGQLVAPWVFLVGDDVRFHAGWLDHAQHIGNRYGADVVGTNDLGNPRVMAGEHATHILLRRSYIDDVGASWDGPGVVCHEYRHWYVDDEIVTAAKQRGVWQMALGSIVEHLHPLWGKAKDDDVYRLGQEAAKADAAKFQERYRASLKAAA